MTPLQQTHRLFRDLQDTLHARSADGDGGVLLSFAGSLTTEIHDALMMMAENALNRSGAKRKLVHRISSTLVECLQNVSRHGWVDDTGQIQLYLTIEQTPLGFQIRSGNLVDFDMAADLRANLSEVNGLTHQELRVRYVERLCNNDWSEKGGAGLGLISMAKKSNGPLDYQFQELEEDMFLFTLAVMVKS